MKKAGLVIAVLLIAITITAIGCKKNPNQLTVEIFNRGPDGGRTLPHDNEWTRWVQKKVKSDLNFNISFIPVDLQTEHFDIINLIKNDSAPHLCYTNSADVISVLCDQNELMDLSPYIDLYLSDLKKLLGDDPAMIGRNFIYRNADPLTGHIYSIPSYRVARAKRNVFIRKDWLDKLGLSIPQTIEEFYSALIAFRNQDPGNVGRDRVIPFGLDINVSLGIAGPVHHFLEEMNDRDRRIYNFYDRYLLMPGYKEGVRHMNRWYNEKLIFQDFSSLIMIDDFYNQIKSGVVGAFCHNWDIPYHQDHIILEELQSLVPGADYVPVDCFKNKEMYDKAGLHIFIPKTAEAKGMHIRALQYLNWLAKFENFNFLQIGQEGVNHILVNGIPSIQRRPAGDEWFQNSLHNIDMTMPINGIELGDDGLNARTLALSYGNINPEIIVNAYVTSIRNARTASVFPGITTVNQNAVDLQGKADSLLIRAITAPLTDFDRIWDTGIEDFLTSGGQEILNERVELFKY